MRVTLNQAVTSQKARLALTTALVGIFATSYGYRRAEAGSCTPPFASPYSCTGVAGADTTQTLTGSPLTVTVTDPDFGITTAAGDAFDLNGNGGVVFTDNYGSAITGDEDGIDAYNDTSGSLSVTTTGPVQGGRHGIYTDNDGTGSLTLNVATVTGDTDNNAIGNGILARNSGTDLSITAGGPVAGGGDGIFARNDGTGSLTLNVATVTGDTDNDGAGRGIQARNQDSGTDLSITASGAVAGGTDGIYARNRGSGVLTLNVASVTGDTDNDGDGRGIFARNLYGTDLSINTSGPVAGGYFGIDGRNYGTGALTLNVASVTGGTNNDNGSGIFALNQGADLSITASGPVAGRLSGIDARHYGTGALTLNVASVIGNTNDNGNGPGIRVVNDGIGPTTITTSGPISGVIGIDVRTRTNLVPTTITTFGSVTGTGGTAISLRYDGHDVLNLSPGAVISGIVDFGNGNDGMGGTNPNDIDTLNFLPGFNGIVTFADSGGAGQGQADPLESAPEIVNFSGGGILTADGLTAVGVDATGFAAQNTMINNLINGVFNSLDSQPTYGSGLGEALGYAHESETKGVDPDRFRFWKSAFGGYSETEAQGNVINFKERFIGHVSGVEKGDADGDGVFGALGGFSRAKVELDFNTGETETDAFFGGLYFKRNAAYARINATFLGGFTQSESERLVGMDVAKGDFDGVFIAPAVTLAASVGSAALPLEIATRISALHWRLDGYTETGSGAPLTVDDRHITQVNLRGQIALPVDLVHDDGSHTQFTARLGVDGTIDAGSDDVQASALGVPFSFDATLDDDVKGFAGLAVRHTSAGGKFALGVSGELQSNTDGDWAASGEVSGAFKL